MKRFLKSIYIGEMRNITIFLFIISHVLVFSLAYIQFRNLPHADSLESLFWGKEWQMGYHKHPPLFALIAEVFAYFFGAKDSLTFVMSQIAVGVAMFSVFLIALELLGRKRAIICFFLLEGVMFSHSLARPWNANLIQSPFWALSGLFYVYAVKYNKPWHYFLLGVFLGLGFLGKYFTLLFAFCIFCSFVMLQEGRKRFKTYLPYLAILGFLITISPHLYWIYKSNFVTLLYVKGKAMEEFSILTYLSHRINFVLYCFVSILFCIIGFLILCKSRKFVFLERLKTTEGSIIFWLSLAPFTIFMLVYLIANIQINNKWASPFFFFTPLFLMYFFDYTITEKSVKKFVYFLIFVVLVSIFDIFISGKVQERREGKHFENILQATIMAEKLWKERFNEPISFVAGGIHEAGYFALNVKSRPSVITCGWVKEILYIDEVKLREKGAVLICKTSSCCVDVEKFKGFVGEEAVSFTQDSVRVLLFSPHTSPVKN